MNHLESAEIDLYADCVSTPVAAATPVPDVLAQLLSCSITATKKHDLILVHMAMSKTQHLWVYPDCFQFARDRLKEISGLSANWDGYGAPTITSKVQALALDVLSHLVTHCPVHVTVGPDVAPTSDGEIQFEWKHENRELQISCTPQGTIEFLRSKGTTDIESSGDSGHVGDAIAWLFSAGG